MVRRFVACANLLAAALALSGCAKEGGVGRPAGFDGDAFSSDRGVVRGVVTDTELRPLEGARVAVEGQGLDARTGPDGRFVLPDVHPGQHMLHVQAIGHHAVALAIDVRAGAPTDVEIALEVAPAEVPYIELLTKRGFVVCDVNAVFVVLAPGPVPGCDQSNALFNQTVADSWRYLVVEAAWHNQESLHVVSDMDSTCFFGTDSDNPCFHWATEPSPVRFDGRPNTTWALAPPEFVYPTGSFDWVVSAAGAGLLQREAAASPLCATFRPNGPACGGIGVGAGYAFDLYLSIFHRQASDLSSYTALPDE